MTIRTEHLVMNKPEAREILSTELGAYHNQSYDELARLIASGPVSLERTGPSGTPYQIEILAVWDDRPDGSIRVMGMIDDGGWRAMFPLTQDFLKTPATPPARERGETNER